MIPSRWIGCYCAVALAGVPHCHGTARTLFTFSTDGATRAGVAPAPGGVVTGNEAGWLSLVSPEGEPVWQVRFDREISARPVVAGETVVAATVVGEWVGVSLAGGAVRWQAKGLGVSATPLATDGVRAFGVLPNGALRAVDAATGAVAWTRAGPPALARSGARRAYGAPLVVKGVLVAPLAEAGVVAVRASSGELAWRQALPGVLGLATDGAEIYAAGENKVLAFGPDGKVRWRRELFKTVSGPPALAAGMLILPCPRSVMGLRLSDGAPTWFADLPAEPSGASGIEGAVLVPTLGLEGQLFAFAPPASEPFARLQFDTPLRFAPLVIKDRVYLLGSDGRLFGLGVVPP